VLAWLDIDECRLSKEGMESSPFIKYDFLDPPASSASIPVLMAQKLALRALLHGECVHQVEERQVLSLSTLRKEDVPNEVLAISHVRIDFCLS
jgi:hypothetical protein